jgi:hypothetical protein
MIDITSVIPFILALWAFALPTLALYPYQRTVRPTLRVTSLRRTVHMPPNRHRNVDPLRWRLSALQPSRN